MAVLEIRVEKLIKQMSAVGLLAKNKVQHAEVPSASVLHVWEYGMLL